MKNNKNHILLHNTNKFTYFLHSTIFIYPGYLLAKINYD